ncbi:D-beta-hydroxybutyrate dehydrogenase, mitochondrial [Hyalella azteca]|uniref:D-beta-hydroxybutyrate dehydrogenase, mitochondrial n=1 Tax=Hyalella azteca TaxID=294128 RepID=A0A8B7N6S2_HYAAZ|nr:D-beta-hydroxybutyrate dehydrogenase, mitochondrial [Hyalella azteca]
MASPTVDAADLDIPGAGVRWWGAGVLRLLPPGEVLWGVVNNAGLATFGDLEWLSLDDYRRLYEVNVLGIVATSQTFLPLVRKARGRVVNISSLLARFAVPMRSPYVASKYAVEGLSDCMRYELRDWGVNVSIIEPGNYIAGTNIFTAAGVDATATRLWETMGEEVRALYGESLFWRRVAVMKKYADAGSTDLTPVLQAFASALLDRWPQPRYQPADLYFKTRCLVATHGPEWLYDALYISTPK